MRHEDGSTVQGEAMVDERWTVGEVVISKIAETRGRFPLGFWLEALPDSSRAALERIPWLRPVYLDREEVAGAVHALLVETPTARIVVDTGIGNGKRRLSPLFDRLGTDFLQRFEAVWPRESVDLVLPTHLHLDHVGWNTVLEDGRWVPTFPNAAYCFVREEYEHWAACAADPDAARAYSAFGNEMVDGAAVFEDSIRPVAEAGLVTWVEPGDTIVPGVTLLGTPGHTPGHTPGTRSRHRFIERFADTKTLVIGTHFGTPTAGRIVRRGSSFELCPVHGRDWPDDPRRSG